ncbi:CAP domain-containing protein [Chloroflexales bacterium ZM16-3]|nr:CAP domain-containing protein [Chloroflexales bacterium ZM16-3]
MTHRTRTLSTLSTLSVLAVLLGLAVLLTSWGEKARAAEMDATYTVYLPLVECPSCTGSAVPVTPVPVTPTPTPAEDVAEVIRLVNIERAKVGCPAVVGEPNLIAATQGWAEYMRANNIAQHAPASWYAPYGYDGALENIDGTSTAQLAVEHWMASHMGHRENLLWCYQPDDPSYLPDDVYLAGVGHAGTYWVWGLTLKMNY